MAPGESDILTEQPLAKIVAIGAGREVLCARRKIDAVTGRDAELPSEVGTKAEADGVSRTPKTQLRDRPQLGAGGRTAVLHLHRQFKPSAPTGHGGARGVAGAPDDRIVFVFFAGRKRGELAPRQRSLRVVDRSLVFVGQRRVDEGILPGIVARHPVADHRGKLTDLHVKGRVGPRNERDRIFVEPDPQPVVAGVEAAIHAGLDETEQARSHLGIEKDREARIEEPVTLREQESGRRLRDQVALHRQQSAQSCPQGVVPGGKGEPLFQPVHPLVARARRGPGESGQNGKHRARPPHSAVRMGPWAEVASRKVTSNSVQSSADLVRRTSPPCKRASSRARLRPSP